MIELRPSTKKATTMTTTTNATDANKALVLAGITGIFIDRDPTVLDRLFSNDYRQHNPQIANGTAAIKALLGNLPGDFKYEPGLVMADGDYVSIHGRYFGWGPNRWWPSISFALRMARSRSIGT
jgi:predicted SnoaL-like aldol condensation-catalyzing enzyme